MATINLPQDFKEFLKLLNTHRVKYLLIGGYAVAYHGYPRAKADMKEIRKPQADIKTSMTSKTCLNEAHR